MKYEYDQNVHAHFGQQLLEYMKIFSLFRLAKGTFSTPKND